jgi:hypothetical protein
MMHKNPLQSTQEVRGGTWANSLKHSRALNSELFGGVTVSHITKEFIKRRYVPSNILPRANWWLDESHVEGITVQK